MSTSFLMVLVYLSVTAAIIWRLEVISNKLDQARLAYFDSYQRASSKRYKPYKLIIAGNYGQFRNWVQSHVVNVFGEQHFIRRDLDEVEFIKVGDWRANPNLDRLQELMTKEQWEQFLNDPVY